MKLIRVMIILTLVALMPIMCLAGKNDDDRIVELETKLAALEAEMNERLAAMEALVDQKIDTAVQEIANREQYATKAYQEIAGLVSKGEHQTAKGKMEAFNAKYAGTEAARKSATMARELAVIGKAVPDTDMEIQKWFMGEGEITSLGGSGTTLVVFWEEWCPHCKREVPNLKTTYASLHEQGLAVIALTEVNKSSTDDKVAAFVQQHQLPFPVAKEPGKIKRLFNVGGIPAAAVVKDGVIVWRGHPARLSETILKQWL
ncbi:MAG: TlpA family protein disulfide reductase [Acidobacteria bacterium]|uniref:TlpA family protein disulfide reductase n=1 Tax=Candidatus Polarisedimenticola svalbardensis TaxID=2886004 RepID=A0A8J6Y075_9BACT|nr:TlpA family protein disulfide reductase [Candidatus Polarisedimenticola svalbardensis]